MKTRSSGTSPNMRAAEQFLGLPKKMYEARLREIAEQEPRNRKERRRREKLIRRIER